MAYTSAEWARWDVNPHIIENITKELEVFQKYIDSGYATVKSIFDIVQTGVGILQGALDTLSNLGLNPFAENPNLLEQIINIIYKSIEVILNAIDASSGYFLQVNDFLIHHTLRNFSTPPYI